ncbi:MAG: hypothetical protein Q3974_06455 [Rothia sp. (in: high G+C Gram-positive bacteria)]|nr:hypothetical protein [Rothia sp. (in: high G+C Gram-positive bacteria)]
MAGTNIQAGFIHVPALDFDTSINEAANELTEEQTLIAHADTGGGEGDSVSTIAAEEAVKTIVLMIEQTIEKGTFI